MYIYLYSAMCSATEVLDNSQSDDEQKCFQVFKIVLSSSHVEQLLSAVVEVSK